jgi:glutamate N-acetyltransferase/amino-acid N-acetyltransferase
MDVSPLAPVDIPQLPPVAGVKPAAGGFALRYKNRPDVLLVTMDEGTACAGIFTRSTTRAAPVNHCVEALKHSPRALLVNAGQANACTGATGLATIKATSEAVAKAAGCKPEQVMLASTGVIGQPINDAKLCAAVESLAAAEESDWLSAANAIRTTDTFAKLATATAIIDGVKVTINGIAKGSGMIAPNMATMLAFLFTDAAIAPETLQQLLKETADHSFNAITVDGDSSTNDTVLAFATGKAGNPVIEHAHGSEVQPFRDAFLSVMQDLAHQIVRDGEGARKFITVHVSGAHTPESARIMALDIANSPLVKTAIAGEDANWGRVVMAVGKSGEPVDMSRLSVAFGEHIIARAGELIPGYDETPVAAYMKQPEIGITVEVGDGVGESIVYTCDLTHGYIDINADYRS